MKRMFASLFAFLFLTFSFVFPVSAEVSNNRSLSENELRQIALTAFPEYASRQPTISIISHSRSLPIDHTLIYSETRSISDKEEITYLEYSSGISQYLYRVTVYTNSASTGSGYATENMDIYLFSTVYSGSIYISGFQYTIVSGGYDQIDSTGNGCITSKLKEDASGPAYARYHGQFQDHLTGYNFTAILYIYVGNNTYSYEVI